MRRERGILYRNATTEILIPTNGNTLIIRQTKYGEFLEPVDPKALRAEQINTLVQNKIELRLYHRSSENYPFRQSMDYALEDIIAHL